MEIAHETQEETQRFMSSSGRKDRVLESGLTDTQRITVDLS